MKTIQITEKTGALVALKAVKEEDDLMITNRSGIVIRMPVSDIRIMGRATQGVRVINLQKKDSIADVTVVVHSDEMDEDLSEDVDTGDNADIDANTDADTNKSQDSEANTDETS